MENKTAAENRIIAPGAKEWLRQKIEHGEVVPFIGAGISMGATLPDGLKMPGYKTLLNNLLESAKSWMNPSIYEECKILVENGKYMIAAEVIDKNLSTTDLYLLLRDQLNHLQPKPSIVHELLNLFDFDTIFTSNYDRMLETSLYPTPEVVTYRDSVSLAVLRREKKPFIFKIHGDLTRPETIVLGWSKYQELQGDNNAAGEDYKAALKSFIQSILQEKTILFLGCSFADSEYGEYFLDFAKTFKTPGKHYALIEKGAVSEKEKRAWYQRMGVEMIEFIPDEHYSQVWEFLASLKPQKKEVTIKQGARFENFYLLNERPDYLTQQLRIEQTSTSCRYLTPGITNCLADENYINLNCDKQLERFEKDFEGDFQKFKSETLQVMLARAKNIEAKLQTENFEFRAIFLLDEVLKELNSGGEIIKNRYLHIIKLMEQHPDNLHLRIYKGTVSLEDYMKSTYALVFYGIPNPDIAYFYAPQATANKFTAHILQINTRPVMERVEHFERFWVASAPEKETYQILKNAIETTFG